MAWVMARYGLTWTEATRLRQWELGAFEELARDQDLMNRNRNRSG